MQGRKLFKGGNYSRKYGISISILILRMDHILRTELAEQCGVPLVENSKVKEDFYIKAIRSSARALLKDKMLQKIPAERKAELTQVLINHFKKGNLFKGC